MGIWVQFYMKGTFLLTQNGEPGEIILTTRLHNFSQQLSLIS